jgi:hypothetical protein
VTAGVAVEALGQESTERVGQIAGGGEALVGPRRAGPSDHRGQVGWDLGGDRRRLAEQAGGDGRRRLDRAGAGEQDVERAAQAVDVGPAVEGAAQALLWGHERHGAADHPGLGRGRAVVGPGDAEVRQLDVAVPRHQQVARLDVAVDQAEVAAAVGGAVGVVEGVGDVGGDDQRDLDREPTAGAAAQLRGVDAVDELQHLERPPVDDAVVEHPDDAGVMEPGRQAGLVEELVDQPRDQRQLGGDLLDRDAAGEAVGADHHRLVDLGHPAGAQAPDHLVAAVSRRDGAVHVERRW